MTATPRVSVRNLTKVYRTRRGSHTALDNVSLDIAAGEFIVLLGPSGCGKTTLLRCIAGLEEPDAGEILIGGKTVFSSSAGVWVPPERRDFSMVFQSYALWPHLSVLENVAYPLTNGHLSKGVAHDKAREGLAKVGLAAYAEGFPGQLSGGQQQRVALARAIVAGSGLILFDEPLSNLDAKVRERLRLELLDLQAQFGFSAVYVTHDQVEALAMADRVAVMGVGRIEQVGPAEAIYDNPVSRYVADFVGSANELPGEVVALGDRPRVRTAAGELVAGGLPDGVGVGDPVWVMIRPEHLHFGEGAENAMTARPVRSMFLGPSRQHIVDVGGLHLEIATQRALPAGDLHLTCAARHVHVFRREG